MRFTLLHDVAIDDMNEFILYSTRSNGTHFFVGSATVSRFMNGVYEIDRLNSRRGYSQTLIKSLMRFYHRVHGHLAPPINKSSRSAFQPHFKKLLDNDLVSKIKIPCQTSYSTKNDCLMYGYQLKKTDFNLIFSSDKFRVMEKLSDWWYFSSLFPVDAEHSLDILEPIRV